ncbi:MAG: hypothetical protein Q4D04_05845 [Clostridia bacterium]|nr:hypothetical protein [Clostridia bacterium]
MPGRQKNVQLDQDEQPKKRRGRPAKKPVESVAEPVNDKEFVEPEKVIEYADAPQATADAQPKASARKPYPSIDERIAAVDRQIAHLIELNESRQALIAKTEAALYERKNALEKSKAALVSAAEKKEMLIAQKNKPPKPVKPKLSPEQRAEARRAGLEKARAARAAIAAAKKEEKERVEELVELLKASGKSMEELIDELKNK